MPINLKELRTATKLSRQELELSQEELGRRINLSQAQVSRYESEPGSAPLETVELWCAACGTTLEDASRAATAVNRSGIDAGEPYATLHRQLETSGAVRRHGTSVFRRGFSAALNYAARLRIENK